MVRVVSVDGSGGEAAVHALGTVQHVSGASGAILAGHAVVETANREGLVHGLTGSVMPFHERARDAELAFVVCSSPSDCLVAEVPVCIAGGDAANTAGDSLPGCDQVVGEVDCRNKQVGIHRIEHDVDAVGVVRPLVAVRVVDDADEVVCVVSVHG